MRVEYPAGAKGSAVVIVQLLVGADGHVAEATAITGEPPFTDGALAAAKGWLFEPARRDGIAVRARIRVRVEFEPPGLIAPPEQAPKPPTTAGASTTASTTSAPAVTTDAMEVVVEGERTVGVQSIGRAEVRQIPGAFGDPYRAIESLPGVTPIASGLPYFFVRGAPPGNVGYFFDGISVPLLYHVGAGPGVLHPAFVSSVDLYAGAYPVKYGRYAGAIVAGEAEPPTGRFRGEASVRLLDSGAFLELPFADGKGSAMLAGRYSYTGLVISLLAPDVSLGYWDYQSRIRYELGPKDTLSLFSFGSHDFLAAADDTGQQQNVLDLTFHRIDARYSHALNTASGLDFTVSLGLDRTGVGGDPNSNQPAPASLQSRSLGARVDYHNQLSPAALLRTGADAKFARMDIDINTQNDDNANGGSTRTRTASDFERRILPAPGVPGIALQPIRQAREAQADQTIASRFLSRDDVIGGVWLDLVLRVTNSVTVTPGFRLDFYDTGGSQLAIAPEPRITARYDISKKTSLTHAFGIAHQPPSFAIPIPGLSGAASDGLQRALQSSAGIETQIAPKLRGQATLFQNVIFNSTDVFGTSTFQRSDAGSSAFSDRTTAHTYGLELQLKRPLTERFGGFLSYTLSRSLRSVPRLSGVSSFDRTHVINAALAYDLGRRWRLGGRVVAYSGIPAEVAYAEAASNPPRTPWFYRLDWRLEKRWLIGSQGAWWALVLEVLNTTLHKETLRASCYAYGCRETAIGPVTIPSIGVEASF
jgi:TonB family protein